MRLLSLEITKFRGIKSARLEPNGKNFVIWGPNGSGKSAIVDAVDFVLTGRIPRLTGIGTGGITLAKYGSHIDHRHELGQAKVKATFEVPGHTSPITLERTVSDPTNLQVLGATPSEIQSSLAVVQKRQHSLSRRDILRFIAAEAGKRSEEVQAILNLEELEETRRSLTTVQNRAKSAERASKTSVANAESAIRTTLGLGTFSWDSALFRVNELRSQLGGTPLSELDRATVKQSIHPPVESAATKVDNPTLLKNELTSLANIIRERGDDASTADSQLRQDIEAIHRSAKALEEAKHLQLYELGISLLDGSGNCPLCGHHWDPQMLLDILSTRKAQAAEIAATLTRIDANVGAVATLMGNARQHVERLRDAASRLGLDKESASLSEWAGTLRNVVSACADPLGDYLPLGLTSEQVKHFFSSDSLSSDANTVVAKAEEASPHVTPQQTAWDTLTRLEANLDQHGRAAGDLKKESRFFHRAAELCSTFEEIRIHELESLYESIESKFVILYRLLHDPDEKDFGAKLNPDGPSLDFDVDFYGRGQHPPLALHSEGHQDSMGLCLYLALVEKLTGDAFHLTVLDDVVMSVDAGHRRQLCTLFREHFANRQFIITTHDKTWAKQLLVEGVAGKDGYVEFTRWSVESGPFVELDSEMWTKIEDDLAQDVPAAAFRLRNGSERFFEMVCDALQAKVRYRISGRWELSDYMDGAIGTLKHLLKAAKASSQSWGKTDEYEKLAELESIVNQIVERTHSEQWAVNASLHYNRWHELSKGDFVPVRDAFRDLFGIFRCAECQSLIRVAEQDGEIASVRCACQKVDWNLVKKPKAQEV